MTFKIVADSSSDILFLNQVPFSSVPLKIITNEKEYIDDYALSVTEMIDDLKKYKGPSKSSCPNTDEWLNAFEDYDCIFCVTITSNLSGSYNSARLALNEYLQANPNRKGFVIDTLSVGPESVLIIEELCRLIVDGLTFEEIKEKIIQYKNRTHLIFCLESMRNLANNGRVSPAVAKIAGLLGIRIVGKASLNGTLEIIDKARGSEKAHTSIIKNMQKTGFCGGKVHVHHCENPTAAQRLAKSLTDLFPNTKITIRQTKALCSFYAESGGMLIGYEG